VILLDTNVISETQRPRGSAAVKRRVEAHKDELFLSAIVMGELRFGVSLQRDPARRSVLATWYGGLAADFVDVVLPVSLEVAECWGELSATMQNAGRRIDAQDGLIAATALVHDLTLWTRNTGDFDGTGVRLLNPWED
jgi:predicted nucleic acid-binding protein